MMRTGKKEMASITRVPLILPWWDARFASPGVTAWTGEIFVYEGSQSLLGTCVKLEHMREESPPVGMHHVRMFRSHVPSQESFSHRRKVPACDRDCVYTCAFKLRRHQSPCSCWQKQQLEQVVREDEGGYTGGTKVKSNARGPTMDLTLLLLVVFLGQQVAGLKLLRINVPAYTLRGKSALLECRYDLGEDKLYSMSWYKDHEEFYRYVPRGEPKKHSYGVEGVKVDHRQSDHQQVLLQDASLHTSGQYKCEVSAEAPSFNSVSAEADMEVVVLPQDGPTITGEEKVYATGDVLSLNCTSGKSHPVATLKWFINSAEVEPDSEAEFKQNGLYSVISSLRLQLQPDHIAGDKINVRCEAIVELDSNSDTPLVETRTTQVFVEGDASLATPCVCLLMASALLLRLLPPV